MCISFSNTASTPCRQVQSSTMKEMKILWHWKFILWFLFMTSCCLVAGYHVWGNILSHVQGSVTYNNRSWIGWLDLLALLLQSPLIKIDYNSSQSMTVEDSFHSLLDYECLLFHCAQLGSDLRIGHFFSFFYPLVNTPQLNTTAIWLTSLLRMTANWFCVYDWMTSESITCAPFIPRCEPNIEHYLQQFTLFCVYLLLCKCVLVLLWRIHA
jgi:hypothetical protein